MANLRQLFETSTPHVLTLDKLVHADIDSRTYSIPTRLHYDFDAAVMYVSVYFENSKCPAIDELLMGLSESLDVLISPQGIRHSRLPTMSIGSQLILENSTPCKVSLHPCDGSSAKKIDVTGLRSWLCWLLCL